MYVSYTYNIHAGNYVLSVDVKKIQDILVIIVNQH